MDYDDIVVGAGSTGAVIAARLSEDSNRRVLLIEAGPVFDSVDALPRVLANAATPVLRGFNWPFIAEPTARSPIHQMSAAVKTLAGSASADRAGMVRVAFNTGVSAALSQFDYVLGRVGGGSSSVNGALALRPFAEDLLEWEKSLGTAWAQETLSAIFDSLLGKEGEMSGGSLPITRASVNELVPIQSAFLEACRRNGFAWLRDHNDTAGDGAGCVTKNARNGLRVSTQVAYLFPALERQNLDVVDRTQVTRLIVEKGRVEGVETEHSGQLSEYRAARVTLSTGAVQSPLILFRSGIGPERELKAAGIKPVRHSPGLGENLLDHPVVGIWGEPKKEISHIGEPIHQTLLRCTSSGSTDRSDMELFMLGGIDTSTLPPLRETFGTDLAAAVTCVLGKPKSIGRLHLAQLHKPKKRVSS